MNRLSQSLLAAVFLTATSVVACSSDDAGSPTGGGGGTTSCDKNPFQCAVGQTCWVADGALDFKCLNSGAGRNGDVCQNFPGEPTCADGLTCFQAPGASGGVCTPYCDATSTAHGCPNGEPCVTAQIQGATGNGPVIQICKPPTPVADAGSDATSGDGAADAPSEAAPPVDAHEASADATGQ